MTDFKSRQAQKKRYRHNHPDLYTKAGSEAYKRAWNRMSWKWTSTLMFPDVPLDNEDLNVH